MLCNNDYVLNIILLNTFLNEWSLFFTIAMHCLLPYIALSLIIYASCLLVSLLVSSSYISYYDYIYLLVTCMHIYTCIYTCTPKYFCKHSISRHFLWPQNEGELTSRGSFNYVGINLFDIYKKGEKWYKLTKYLYIY